MSDAYHRLGKPTQAQARWRQAQTQLTEIGVSLCG